MSSLRFIKSDDFSLKQHLYAFIFPSKFIKFIIFLNIVEYFFDCEAKTLYKRKFKLYRINFKIQ